MLEASDPRTVAAGAPPGSDRPGFREAAHASRSTVPAFDGRPGPDGPEPGWLDRFGGMLDDRVSRWSVAFPQLRVAAHGQGARRGLEIGFATSRSGAGFGCLVREFVAQGWGGALLAAYLERTLGVAVAAEPQADILLIDGTRLAASDAAEAMFLALEAGLAALAGGRGDVLMGGGPADADGPTRAHRFDGAEPALTATQPPDWVVESRCPVSFAGALIDIDPSLAFCGLDALERIAANMADKLQPFELSRRRLDTAAGVVELREIHWPDTRHSPSGGAGGSPRHRIAVQGAGSTWPAPGDVHGGLRCAMFAILILLDQICGDGGIGAGRPVLRLVGDLPPALAGWTKALEKRCRALADSEPAPVFPITILMPGHAPDELPNGQHGLVVDLFRCAGADARARLEAAKVLLVDGVRVALRGEGGNFDLAQVEALLCLLEGVDQAVLDDPERFMTLASRHGLSIGPFNIIPAFGGREGRSGAGSLPAPRAATGNICERLFSNANLASGSRIIDPLSGLQVGYRDLQAWAGAYMGGLRALGIGRNAVVALAAQDGIPAVALMIACAASGIVFAPLNYTSSAAHLRIVVETLRPTAIFVWRTTPHDDVLRDYRLIDLSQLPTEAAMVDPFESLPLEPSAPLVMLATSGSTGAPKVVLHSHADIWNGYLNYGRAVVPLRRSDTVYTPSRLFFAYGLNNLLLSLMAGASHVIGAPLGSPDAILRAIENHGVTVFLSVPAILKMMLGGERSAPLPRLRLMVSAGEALPPRLRHRLVESFQVDVIDGIGCTEVLSTFISCRPGHAGAASAGFVVPGFEVRLVDEHGEACRVGEVGRLLVRGDTVCDGYVGDAAFAEELFPDGWLWTQDIFVADALGRFHFVGRSSSAIKINGSWVSLEALDEALQSHPAVGESVTCVAPDEFDLPRPVAFVVLASSSDASSELWEQLRSLSRASLGRDNYPHAFVPVAEIPRTSSGKVMRGALLDGWKWRAGAGNGATRTSRGERIDHAE